MSSARLALVLAAVTFLFPGPGLAQQQPPPGTPPELPGEASWEFEASFLWYFVPDQTNFGVGTIAADHGPLHLEARYNYEASRTGSAFVGWNLGWGETLRLELTPIVGCMVGEAGGPILGLEVELGWGPLSFSSQDEWVWDFRGGGGFFYSWAELDVRPWKWLRAGMVLQRTRVFHTPREVILGPLLGLNFWKVDLSVYWFQPGGIDQFLVAAIGVSF